MTQHSNARRNGTKTGGAEEGLPIFHGNVADLVMIDRNQAQLFSALGRTRSPFQGVADWPFLDEALALRSAQVLAAEGKERWSAAGGIRGPDGRPTCLLTSPMTAQVVRKVAADPGGLLWQDAQGAAWAVRLVPVGGRAAAAYFGFAIGGPGFGAAPTPCKPRPPHERKDLACRQLGRQAEGLWLGARAAQILMMIHCAVLSQRRSAVLLPDVMLGQVVWGGGRSWPRDWRGDVFSTLRSLACRRCCCRRCVFIRPLTK